MRSARALMGADPVLAAGIGVRRGRRWPVRSASFRIAPPAPGRAALGIQVTDPAAGTALVDVLAGSGPARLAYGELRVFGCDMTLPRCRARALVRVGAARRAGRLLPGLRVRSLAEHAIRRSGLRSAGDRRLLAAAILDRLSLSPWAEVPLRLAPEHIVRRARLAAAAAGQPDLLLLDGLLDGLPPRAASGLADCIRDLGRDAGILITGRDVQVLALACDEILTLTDGILVSG